MLYVKVTSNAQRTWEVWAITFFCGMIPLGVEKMSPLVFWGCRRKCFPPRTFGLDTEISPSSTPWGLFDMLMMLWSYMFPSSEHFVFSFFTFGKHSPLIQKTSAVWPNALTFTFFEESKKLFYWIDLHPYEGGRVFVVSEKNLDQIHVAYRYITLHGPLIWPKCAIFLPSLAPPADPVELLWFKTAGAGVPHIVLHVLCLTRTSRGVF